MRPTFNVTDFQDVVNVQMNDPMRRLLIELIDEFDGNDLEIELRAFRNALHDPQGAQFKKEKRANNGHRRRHRQREPV